MGSEYLRQLDILSPEIIAGVPFTIIGAGAIGSFTCLTLAKMGAQLLTVYDNDTVEPHNYANQWYGPKHLGQKKVAALQELVHDLTGATITAKSVKYVKQPMGQVVICGVDSMDTRIKIWRWVQKHQPKVYIDGRMGAEVGNVFCVKGASGEDRKVYETQLFPSSEALRAPCTAQSTMYCAAGLAAFIGAQVSAYLNGRRMSNLVVDFRTMYLAEAV